MDKAAKLIEAASSAAEVRAHQTNPNVVALHVERVRGWVDRLIWTGMVLGLLFTMANVQHFASGGTKPPWVHGAWKDGSAIEWIIAWLLDPTVSLIVVGVLMGEQAINRHGLTADTWVRVTKWVALGCTYAMNTWSAWFALVPSQIVLHSVPPVIVVCAAEVGPALRRQITEAVRKAYEAAADRSQDRSPDAVDVVPAMVPGPVPEAVPDAVPGPLPGGPQDQTEPVPGPALTPVQDQSQDHDETVLDDTQDRPPKRSQARRRTTSKSSQKGRVTQAEWEKRVRQAAADHPGIDLNPSPIATVLGLDAKTRASGGFKRAVTAVRESAVGA
jgi:hypothetical protein